MHCPLLLSASLTFTLFYAAAVQNETDLENIHENITKDELETRGLISSISMLDRLMEGQAIYVSSKRDHTARKSSVLIKQDKDDNSTDVVLSPLQYKRKHPLRKTKLDKLNSFALWNAITTETKSGLHSPSFLGKSRKNFLKPKVILHKADAPELQEFRFH